MDPVEPIKNAAEWVGANWQVLFGAAGAAVALASAIAKLTPSTKDDKAIAKVAQWLSILQPRGVPGVKLPGTRPTRSRE